MNCAWHAFIRLVPHSMRKEVDTAGQLRLQELRLRLGQHPIMIMQDKTLCLPHTVTDDDISFVVNAASQYSPWTASTVSNGYLTACGGHRIGVCGDAVIHGGETTGFHMVTSLCMRVARDFPGISCGADDDSESVLIIGPPGSGKTTFLRDLIRNRAKLSGGSIGVVDERGEIFPRIMGKNCFMMGAGIDVLSNCEKGKGVIMLLRTMSPLCIAVDEITLASDAEALFHAGWSGVKLIATAHAASKSDLCSRPVYCSIMEHRLFDRLIVMHKDKSWHGERL